MLLIGVFAEDISMYVIRSPHFNFMTLIENILTLEFNKSEQLSRQNAPKSLQTHLKGRMFASSSSIIDLLNIHDPLTVRFMKCTISIAIDVLQSSTSPISVKLVATRCLTRYLRKLP